MIKLWIHISKEEQLKRFRERERLHYKSWKLTRRTGATAASGRTTCRPPTR